MLISQDSLEVSDHLRTFAMNKRRGRAKVQNEMLNRQLIITKQEQNRITEQKILYIKVGNLLLDLGKLVFGGVLIGGLFEDFKHPNWLYGLGALSFIAFMYYGTSLFIKGTKKNK